MKVEKDLPGTDFYSQTKLTTQSSKIPMPTTTEMISIIQKMVMLAQSIITTEIINKIDPQLPFHFFLTWQKKVYLIFK